MPFGTRGASRKCGAPADGPADRLLLEVIDAHGTTLDHLRSFPQSSFKRL